jgi:glycosyltransferase involved in cell wall biosynthesis
VSKEFTPGLVSIIVASYNHADYLIRRMESLVNQTYPDIEILVIDDCSSDHSVEILQKYISYPNVKLILREQNGGWVTVSNQGVELSRGEYILFANCDDDCDVDLVSQLVRAIIEHKHIGLVFCRSLMIDENDIIIGDDFQVRESSFKKRCVTNTVITGTEFHRFLMHSCVIPNLSAALFRRTCLNDVGLLSHAYRACSDWDLFFRLSRYNSVGYLSKSLNKFRQHGTTIRSATKGRITYDEFFMILLGQIRNENYTFWDRCRFRHHVMYLWAIELLRPSQSGWVNFFHHLKFIYKLDPSSLFFFIPACVTRLVNIFSKVFLKLQSRVQ